LRLVGPWEKLPVAKRIEGALFGLNRGRSGTLGRNAASSAS
jgi:hypothetical protein